MYRYLESRILGTESVGSGTPPSTLPAFYWYFIRQTKFWYGAMVLSVLAVALVDLTVPVSIGRLTELVQANDRVNALQEHWVTFAVLLGMLIVVRPLLQMVDVAIRFNVLSSGVTTLIRWQSHWHVVRQGWPFFQNDFAGRIANRVMQTPSSLRESVMSTIRAVLFICTYLISSLALMFWADWRLAIPTLVWALGYVFFLRYFVPKLLTLAKVSSESRSAVMARIVDSYSNILTVKLFARAADEDAYVREAMDENQRASAAHLRKMSHYLLTLSFMNATLIAATVFIGIGLWAYNGVSPGLVATAVPLAWQIANMSGWISFEIAGIFENIGTVQEGMQSIAVPHALVDRKDAQCLNVTKGEIQFNQVDFAYATGAPVLKNLNLVVKPGERVGIVGRSGAGKSTLINLLLRFFDVSSGAIVIDGQNVRNVTQESLRGLIGVVTQDTSLLHRSIADNIRYGRPNATDDEVVSAARWAQAHEFIAELCDWKGRKGYGAHVGERGVKLSGGQRQRIAIARVVLKNAPILILDEATSALDSEVEGAIQEQLMALMQGKTVIAIAHRLSTIAQMDRLIVLDHGQVVEQGSHAELLALEGQYASLWRRQSGGFLPEDLDTELSR